MSIISGFSGVGSREVHLSTDYKQRPAAVFFAECTAAVSLITCTRGFGIYGDGMGERMAGYGLSLLKCTIAYLAVFIQSTYSLAVRVRAFTTTCFSP